MQFLPEQVFYRRIFFFHLCFWVMEPYTLGVRISLLLEGMIPFQMINVLIEKICSYICWELVNLFNLCSNVKSFWQIKPDILDVLCYLQSFLKRLFWQRKPGVERQNQIYFELVCYINVCIFLDLVSCSVFIETSV